MPCLQPPLAGKGFMPMVQIGVYWGEHVAPELGGFFPTQPLGLPDGDSSNGGTIVIVDHVTGILPA